MPPRRDVRLSHSQVTFALELARALRLVRRAERERLAGTPARSVAAMRALGTRKAQRNALDRDRLRSAISLVDRFHPRGPNCYRRVLLELALDGGAARETLVFGLDVGKTGHVAFKERAAQHDEKEFDVAFEIA